jgi:hypothetical protein
MRSVSPGLTVRTTPVWEPVGGETLDGFGFVDPVAHPARQIIEIHRKRETHPMD